MKAVQVSLLVFVILFKTFSQSGSTFCPITLDSTESLQKKSLTNLSIGFGFAEAIRFRHDEFNRNHDFRFLVNLNLLAKIYHPVYIALGFEYSKKDVDGYFDSFNCYSLLSFGGTMLKRKITYFIEAGPNMVSIYYPSKQMITFSPGLAIGFRAQYNLDEIYSVGVDLRHINYFNVWSDHYFIIHSNIFFSVKI